MKASKIFAVLFGALGVLIGTALAATAFVVLVGKPDDGFVTTDAHIFNRPSNAIVSEDIDLFSDAPRWVVGMFADPVEIRITGSSASGQDQFVGIGPSFEVADYLANVNHDEISSISFDDEAVTDVRYDNHPGSAVPAPPAGQDFWEVSIEGVGTQTLEWDIDAGNWTVVAMNADGSAGVDAELEFGLKISNLGTVAWSVFGFGVFSMLLGGFLFYLGLRPPRMTGPPPPQTPPPQVPPIIAPDGNADEVDLRDYVEPDPPAANEPRAPSDPLLG